MNIELLITITTAIVIANVINQAVVNRLFNRARSVTAVANRPNVKVHSQLPRH
ncbi:hypothetical protein [Vibrio alginolyticus]|uniref:hypothetical protein n=1 Tax=Vibrio alginolyticus TaxID=663 RepID=UPI00211A64A8|nr:hypothetical protein [Vibrio alginolyticus]MCQ9090961.1 hypothetical protein [Vibrio alginolyticus]